MPTFCLGHSPVNNKGKGKTPRELKVGLGEKLLKIDELGETIEEITFSEEEEGLDENLEKD